MFGCLSASFCSFSFFLPKHHSFAQLNVPNASRWSVLIPKCVLSVACSFDLPDATKVLSTLFWKSRPLWKKTWENMMFFRALHASFVQETKRYIILAMLTESPGQKTQDYGGSDVFLEMILFSFFALFFSCFTTMSKEL